MDTQPLTPLVQPTIRCTSPLASALLDNILDKISVSLCGEEDMGEELGSENSLMCVIQPGERDEVEEMSEGGFREKRAAVYSSRRVCSGGSLLQQPLEENVDQMFDEQSQPKALSTVCEASYGGEDTGPTPFVCKASGSDSEQECTFNVGIEQQEFLYTPSDEEFWPYS